MSENIHTTQTTAVQPPLADWLRLVRAEYLESPGLSLTRPQVQRLWGLDAGTCDELLQALQAARFLTRTARDAYVLANASR